MNVLICDPISPKGIALFQSRPEFKVTVLEKPLKEAELLPVVKDVEAMVVRSETKVSRKVIEAARSEEHTSELQSQSNLVCRLLLEKKNTINIPLRKTH